MTPGYKLLFHYLFVVSLRQITLPLKLLFLHQLNEDNNYFNYDNSQQLVSIFYVPSTMLSTLHGLHHLIITITLWGGYYYHLLFTDIDEKNEAVFLFEATWLVTDKIEMSVQEVWPQSLFLTPDTALLIAPATYVCYDVKIRHSTKGA